MESQRYHFFNITFAGMGKQNGMTSRIIKLEHPAVTHPIIEGIREADAIDALAPLISVSYLGHMTENEWSTETWQPKPQQNNQKPQQSKAFQRLSIACLVICSLLLSALAVTTYFNLR